MKGLKVDFIFGSVGTNWFIVAAVDATNSSPHSSVFTYNNYDKYKLAEGKSVNPLNVIKLEMNQGIYLTEINQFILILS